MTTVQPSADTPRDQMPEGYQPVCIAILADKQYFRVPADWGGSVHECTVENHVVVRWNRSPVRDPCILRAYAIEEKLPRTA
jgi:hypothetical protein